MTGFKKLALISAVALVSGSAFALEAVDDSTLSETTGQDGVTLGITLPSGGLSFSAILHDSDGFTSYTTSAGAIVVGDPRAAGGSFVKAKLASTGEIQLNIDATGDVDTVAANNQAAVRINVNLTSALTFTTGTLSVAKSNGLGVALNTSPVDQTNPFMNSMDITVGSGSLMNIFLGNEPNGGHMIDINTTLTGGLTISNFSLNDTGGAVRGGSIAVTTIKMCDTDATATCGTTNLQVKANVDIASTTTAPTSPNPPTDGGLILTLSQVGLSGASGGLDAEMTEVKLGSSLTPAIGNIDIVGLNLAGTAIRIVGH